MTKPPKPPRKPAAELPRQPAAKRPAKASPALPSPTSAAATGKGGERIAKVLARAGVASRREAERLIAAGLVRVNGKLIDSPALDVGPRDRILIDGKPLPAKQPVRLWLYHKPLGLVTTEADEQGRPTVFENLPEGMPRVMSVGRLDLNSEGLLLLTNDGDLKRRLELPATGWLRKYRVRVNGNPTDPDLEPLRRGIEVEGTRFQPMDVTLDRVQGANAWLTVGLREGKNREVRRAMGGIGLTVNRLIRVSYGPFRLGELPEGAVEEVRPTVLRDQLGLTAAELGLEDGSRPAPMTGRAPRPAPRKPAQAGRDEAPFPRRTREADRDAPARTTSRAPAEGKPTARGRGDEGTKAAPAAGPRAGSAKPGFGKPAPGKVAGSRASGSKWSESKPTGSKPTGSKPTGRSGGKPSSAPSAGGPRERSGPGRAAPPPGKGGPGPRKPRG